MDNKVYHNIKMKLGLGFSEKVIDLAVWADKDATYDDLLELAKCQVLYMLNEATIEKVA